LIARRLKTFTTDDFNQGPAIHCLEKWRNLPANRRIVIVMGHGDNPEVPALSEVGKSAQPVLLY